ncbi:MULTISPECIES: hypothetical protein [Actinomadura]|uniref:MerR family transcriptional regulator n=1 Tax=Actinomadura yumaensis TaxID=111807 RepID=A0ABW2CWA5_9ACTN|nr:hypothetical protein [Actinomadura sp. J1-007]MWK39591.1 hypothetical protein [Actinomadura sp. J1-007]
MNEPRCACGQPARDATFCASCAYRLDEAIAQISVHHGLAWDLELATTRQARLGDRGGPRSAQVPLPYDERAGDAATTLHRALARWAAVIARETTGPRRPGLPGPVCGRRARCAHPSCRMIRASRPPEPPPVTLTGLATWLRPRVGWLRHHAAGQQAYDEILAAVAAARRVVDRPAERLYAGPCDDCGEDLYARPGAAAVPCPGCHAVYEVEARRAWLLRAAEDVLASATDISRAITRLGQPVTPEAIRGYAHRGLLLPRTHRTTGGRTVPLYRLGDVVDVLTRQAARRNTRTEPEAG